MAGRGLWMWRGGHFEVQFLQLVFVTVAHFFEVLGEKGEKRLLPCCGSDGGVWGGLGRMGERWKRRVGSTALGGAASNDCLFFKILVSHLSVCSRRTTASLRADASFSSSLYQGQCMCGPCRRRRRGSLRSMGWKVHHSYFDLALRGDQAAVAQPLPHDRACHHCHTFVWCLLALGC